MALEAALPVALHRTCDKVDRQMATGLALVEEPGRRGLLRHVVVVSLGTNGTVTARQLRQLQRAAALGASSS